VRPLVRPANPPKPPPPPVPDPPGGTGYPIVRLDTLTNLRNDLAGITLTRPSQTVRDGLNIPNGPVTMRDVVDGLLTLATQPSAGKRKRRKKNDPPPPPLTPIQAAKSNLESQVELYRDANPYLKTDLGLYCDYCEQVLSEMIAVEHIVPKAPFPLTSLSWQNFLLCCRACNSKKLDKPARAELATWNLNPAPTNEVERYAAIRGHYLWPDNGYHTVNYPQAYKGLVPAFFFYEGNGWKQLTDKYTVADGLVPTNRGTALDKTVLASIPDLQGGTWDDLPVQVKLVPAGMVAAEAQATLDMMDMNNDGAGKNDDNRIWHRTLAWLDAVEAFTDLKQSWSPSLFKATCKNAGHGFLSTWVRVLELRGGGAIQYPADTSKTLMQAFIAAMTQRTTQPYGSYPSTNTTYLP
jgi:5-methylcytosine-specific restriction endonuclease McrA